MRRYVVPGGHFDGIFVGVKPPEVSNLHSLSAASLYPISLKTTLLIMTGLQVYMYLNSIQTAGLLLVFWEGGGGNWADSPITSSILKL